ncbi:MAG TPA: GNAT family N-acetyltransferase [Solirubrobacteraceae bacterium]|nr:GNAT family N-acetyltransferase [Solirubrobacteraceae bacterium]
MSAPAAIRPATAADSGACFAIFRHSLADLLGRLGYRPPGGPPPDLDALWPDYESLFGHLAATCAQWWIAEHPADGRPLGYARSVQRAGTVELTEFFVDPATRVGGIGRALLERAFPRGLGERRAIIATLDAPAIALYLRFDVAHQTTGVGVTAVPRACPLPAGYEAAPAALEEVLAIERELLGHAREPEVAFMLADRPAAVLRRGGRPVAYACEPNAGGFAGPVAALEPEHMPAALAYLENAAHGAGLARIDLTVPLSAQSAVTWLLGERGFRVDPFYCLFLADRPWAKLDRYLPFNPCLFL